MLKRRFILLSSLTLIISLSSCEFKCNVGKTDDTSEKKTTTTTNTDDDEGGVNNEQVMNEIEISTKGDVKVFRAFLANESGSLVRDNTTSPNVPIILNLNIEKGWEEKDGRTFLGATQNITTDKGEEVLNTGDLFSKYDESGLSADNAKMITLKANITRTLPEIEYFVVKFRVWDKNGSGEVSGNYKFYVK